MLSPNHRPLRVAVDIMARRGRHRTVLLAIAACAALFWGAVDIVGVPVWRLWEQFIAVSAGVALVVACAAAAGWGFVRFRRKR